LDLHVGIKFREADGKKLTVHRGLKSCLQGFAPGVGSEKTKPGARSKKGREKIEARDMIMVRMTEKDVEGKRPWSSFNQLLTELDDACPGIEDEAVTSDLDLNTRGMSPVFECPATGGGIAPPNTPEMDLKKITLRRH
jgi:hypothetical protein